jgi:hypothetical protein
VQPHIPDPGRVIVKDTEIDKHPSALRQEKRRLRRQFIVVEVAQRDMADRIGIRAGKEPRHPSTPKHSAVRNIRMAAVYDTVQDASLAARLTGIVQEGAERKVEQVVIDVEPAVIGNCPRAGPLVRGTGGEIRLIDRPLSLAVCDRNRRPAPGAVRFSETAPRERKARPTAVDTAAIFGRTGAKCRIANRDRGRVRPDADATAITGVGIEEERRDDGNTKHREVVHPAHHVGIDLAVPRLGD